MPLLLSTLLVMFWLPFTSCFLKLISVRVKNAKLTTLKFYLIIPKIFTALKTPISHLKGHKICFLGKKFILIKISNIFKKNLNHTKLVETTQIKGLFEATTILHDEVHASV